MTSSDECLKTKSITGDDVLFLTPLLWFWNRGEEND